MAWCIGNLRKLNVNMTFFSIEANNDYYFEGFKEVVYNDFRMDGIPGRSIYLAFAISCFFHPIEKDYRTYFHEIRRFLTPDCTAYILEFVIDRYSFEYMEKTEKHKAGKEKEPAFYSACAGQGFFGDFTKRKWN